MNVVKDLITLTSGGVFIAVGQFLSDVAEFVAQMKETLTGELSPEKRAKLMVELEKLETKLKALQAEIATKQTEQQVRVNIEETKTKSLFLAGWRPFVGWVCAFGFTYATVIQPLLTWVCKLAGVKALPPTLDTETLVTTLFALLGFGTLRSFEKLKGIHNKH